MVVTTHTVAWKSPILSIIASNENGAQSPAPRMTFRSGWDQKKRQVMLLTSVEQAVTALAGV